MGSGSSCYPSKDHRGSIDSEPYDAKRLLSELITVQTAIVLTDDIGKGDCKHSGHRNSIEYTITTSLTVPMPGMSLSGQVGIMNDLSCTGLEFQGGALMDIMTAHFKHKVDVVTSTTGLHAMPSIQEMSEVSTC